MSFSFKMGSHVSVTKIGVTEKAEFPTPQKVNYFQGEVNGPVSLPMDYNLRGFLASVPLIGKTLNVDRYERNGTKVSGLFTSSTILNIIDDRIYTRNSVYLIKSLGL